MNAAELRSLKKLIITVADYYGRDIKPEVVTMMAEDLKDLPFWKVHAAYSSYRTKDKQMRFPMPSTIRELICPSAEPRALAIEAATRAIAAVSKFGWPAPHEAREYIGELGWRAVERIGGWVYLCENLGVTLQVTTLQAQIRDACEATIKLGDAGVHDQPIGLPDAKTKQVGLTSSADVIDGLLPKGEA